MRIRIYGAQLNPGPTATPYVKTTLPQQTSGVGNVSLRWGLSLAFETTDPGWTTKGARFNGSDLLTAWKDDGTGTQTLIPYVPAPTNTLSALIKLSGPFGVSGTHLTDLGGCGLGTLDDGTLSWWIGSTFYPTNTTLQQDVYYHLIYACSPSRVDLWVNGSPIASLNIPTQPAPTQFYIGGQDSNFDVASVTFYGGALPYGGVLHTYRFAQVIAGRLGLSTLFGKANFDQVGYDVAAYGDGYQDVRFQDYNVLNSYAVIFPIDGQGYPVTYTEVQT